MTKKNEIADLSLCVRELCEQIRRLNLNLDGKKETDRDSECLSVPEAARMLNISDRTVFRLIQTDKIGYAKIRGRTLIPRQAIEQIIGKLP